MNIRIMYYRTAKDGRELMVYELLRKEIVTAKGLDDPELIKHICGQTDEQGNEFEKVTELFSFDYKSNCGGVVAEEYHIRPVLG